MKVLGISCFYHDSAASLVIDGEVVAAAEEERFSRNKHDNSFPEEAIEYCLNERKLEANDLDKIVFYEKPIIKFDRFLETTARSFPRGFKLFSQELPEWVSTKLRIRKVIRKNTGFEGEIEFVEHHRSHAASAFYPSPYDEAAVLTVDGIGEKVSNQLWKAENGDLEPIKSIEFPNSIGLLYSTITAFLGFRVNNGEFKVMGLASYGDPNYREEFEELIDIDSDGSYELNQDYFAYQHSKKMYSNKITELLGTPRSEDDDLTQRHKDIAATVQEISEEIVLKQVCHINDLVDSENLCMAGGVALNSVCNAVIEKQSEFENVWIQPAAGDSGGALGAAIDRSQNPVETMEDVYLGSEFSNNQIKDKLEKSDFNFEKIDSDFEERIAEELVQGKIAAVFRGRMEWGPRALGNRSIIADPRSEDIRDKINQKVKFREDFRPFAPTVLNKNASEYFDIEEDIESPYMLFVYDVKDSKKDVLEGVTHVDGTSRIQTLKEETNQFYYNIIDSFQDKTGVPVVLNTSFNLKGMPIVRTPEEALNCFKQSDIDLLVLEDYLVTQE